MKSLQVPASKEGLIAKWKTMPSGLRHRLEWWDEEQRLAEECSSGRRGQNRAPYPKGKWQSGWWAQPAEWMKSRRLKANMAWIIGMAEVTVRWQAPQKPHPYP
jgi:hypothetical protein